MTWLGLDIGGANLKAANVEGWAVSRTFALWREWQGLSDALAALIAEAPESRGLAVTMTGELCDCYESKGAGVRHILSAVEKVSENREVLVFLVDGRFVSTATARNLHHLAAASNWRALAEYSTRFAPRGTAFLIDIGSTTSDIIPIVNGQVAAVGQSDTERLLAHELIYSGVGRTPICAVTNTLPWRGQRCPVAAEVFATTADAYVILGKVEEDPHANWTADGRPLTKTFACQRLARQICADAVELTRDDIEQFAECVFHAQLLQLTEGLRTVLSKSTQSPDLAIVSGSGEFLACTACESVLASNDVKSLTNNLGAAVSRSAPAYAVAVLAEERAK